MYSQYLYKEQNVFQQSEQSMIMRTQIFPIKNLVQFLNNFLYKYKCQFLDFPLYCQINIFMKKNEKVEESYAKLMEIKTEEKGQNKKNNKMKEKKNIKIDLNQLILKCSEKVDQEFTLERLKENGPFLTYVSQFLVKMLQKLMVDFDLFYKTKFLQISHDALSTKDRPVRRKRVYNRLSQKNQEEQKQQQAYNKLQFIAEDISLSPQIHLIRLKKEDNILNMPLDVQFQDLAEPNLNLIEQDQHSQQPKIDKQDFLQVEEQINIAGGLINGSYKRTNNEKKKRKRYDYILDNMNNKVVNKFIEGQDLEKFITGNIQQGVKRLQNLEFISVLMNVEPKVRLYSHLLPSKLELKQYEQRGRPVQELRGQNTNISQEQLQDFGYGFGFLDDKPPIQQEPPEDIEKSQQYSQQNHSQQYSQQMDIELQKNFTYSFQHSGLLFNSFIDRQDKSLNARNQSTLGQNKKMFYSLGQQN
ncbi:hypothetical protein pb186bvf_002495 [Paramecium bursaria]